jgi:hypothetical protein
MAKLFYEQDFGTIAVRADDDEHCNQGEIEVTAEQATALAAGQIALALSYLYEAFQDISEKVVGGRTN